MASTAQRRFQAELAKTARAADKALGGLIKGSASPRLLAAMRYASLNGGKRLRPFLVVQSAKLFGVRPSQAIRVGAALECVHCYSLVHDDLPAMDNDDLRRGKPTAHRKFDEATAILAGDALLTLAFEILADRKTSTDPSIRSNLVTALAKSAGAAGMVGGQMLDIQAETRARQSLGAIRRIQSGKTGALFRFACESGALLAGQKSPALVSYANHMGLAFQIADDVLDVLSTPEQLGKATQKDQSSGKATFVDLLGLTGARRAASKKVELAVQALEQFGPEADLLREAARFAVSRSK